MFTSITTIFFLGLTTNLSQQLRDRDREVNQDYILSVAIGYKTDLKLLIEPCHSLPWNLLREMVELCPQVVSSDFSFSTCDKLIQCIMDKHILSLEEERI